jgi:hypothetical protein
MMHPSRSDELAIFIDRLGVKTHRVHNDYNDESCVRKL